MEKESRVPKNRDRKPTGGKRTAEQIESDKNYCSDLFVRGYTYRQIADALNKHNLANGFNYTITFQQVHKDIKSVLESWREMRFERIDDWIQIELQKLDRIEFELWGAWEASKGGKQRVEIEGGDIKGRKATGGAIKKRVTESKTGDARYLELLLNVQKRRATLIGYDAPMKIDIPNTIKVEETSMRYNINNIPDDVLFKMADAIQDAKAREVEQEKQKASKSS